MRLKIPTGYARLMWQEPVFIIDSNGTVLKESEDSRTHNQYHSQLKMAAKMATMTVHMLAQMLSNYR